MPQGENIVGVLKFGQLAVPWWFSTAYYLVGETSVGHRLSEFAWNGYDTFGLVFSKIAFTGMPPIAVFIQESSQLLYIPVSAH